MGVYSYDSINKNLIPVAGSGSDMTGATSSTAGTHGLAPAPQAGDQNKFLKGDGTWGAAATDDNFVGTLAEWNALTPAEKEQYNTADITDDFNDMPVDHMLSLASENPVQNKVITEALNTERQTVVNEIGAITSELENKPNTFTGTQAQWDALTATQKAQYTLVCINDDLNFTPPIDDELSTTSERALQNKVITAKLINVEDFSSRLTDIPSGVTVKAYKYGRIVEVIASAGTVSVAANSAKKIASYPAELTPIDISITEPSGSNNPDTHYVLKALSDGYYLKNSSSSAQTYIQGRIVYISAS